MSSWAESWARSSPRNRIVLATSSPDLERRLQEATDGACLNLPLGPLPPNPAALFSHLGDAPRPELVVLDAGADPAPALTLAALFDVQCPGITVIVVSPEAQEIGTEAMHAGVRAILDPGADEATIRSVLDRAYESTRSRARDQDLLAAAVGPAPVGRVITVASAKGGVGRTTVATNLAVGLARTGRGSTVLVDLDLQFGDVATALGLEPEYTLPDAVRGLATRDTMVLKTFLTLHETGLYVICGPATPAEGDTVTADAVSRLLAMLTSEFAHVVVDTGVGLSEHVLAALDESSDVVLVTGMDVPGVRDLRKALDALDRLSLLSEARHVVLNGVDERAGLTVGDVEATLGVRADVLLPRSAAALAAVNEGVPLLQRPARREPVTRQLQQLQARLVPQTAALSGVPAPLDGSRRSAAPASRWSRGRRRAG
jgi:pilus assembly protein CpaE